ncbi:type I DNA topoisomerase [Candidatus Parcubacteria bacterium]|nr:type I DNA topoisomerase [Candidatus Parcubacteria bacterium]
MSKNLVIVESPAKAKTIEKFLGNDFMVKSSFGHIRDLPAKGLSIDVENGFIPDYEIPASKKKVVSELKQSLKDNPTVWLASDEDREGEAIAWHLCAALKLDPKSAKRIVFHEITKSAIDQAVKNPRVVNEKLVDAQQARRILDRLVGYELSPVLWKKIQRGLSAGRVQSVAVRLIVEREREIKNFQSKSQFRVSAHFEVNGQALKAELAKALPDAKTALELLEKLKNANFKVDDIDQKPGSRNPSAPFTTSSLQQEASTKLGFSVKQTMTLAQRLYENGHITYIRTDSTNLSDSSISAMAEYINSEYGERYHQVRKYKTKSASAQEAHEAIRPSNIRALEAGADSQQIKLYKLIWRRALASQMASAQFDRSEIKIANSSSSDIFIAKGEILSFDGYLKVYGGGKDDVILPEVKIGDQLQLDYIRGVETYDRPPARYSEASLVRKLEELGIGRPSTYAPTISTIQTRGYIEKSDAEGVKRKLKNLILKNGRISHEETEETTGAERGKLLPTYIADVTTDFLVKHFGEIVNYDFTAKAEASFDEIAEGKIGWQEMLKKFYGSFHPLIEKSADVSREETSQARLLGHDPKTKKPIMARYGRFSPMLQKGETESEEKPAFAPLPEGTGINSVTLEQALEMFKLPREVGKTEDGKPILANIGRFGPYVQVDKIYISIKPLDPLTIDEAKARELYAEKLEKEKNKYIRQFDSGISIINGPFGPYITDGKKNARITKDLKPEELDEQTCKELLAAAPARKKRPKRRPSK